MLTIRRTRPPSRDPGAYGRAACALVLYAALVALLYQGYAGLRQLTAPRGVVTVTRCVLVSGRPNHQHNYSYSCTGDFTGSSGHPRLPGVSFGFLGRSTLEAGTTMRAWATNPPGQVSLSENIFDHLFLGGMGVAIVVLGVAIQRRSGPALGDRRVSRRPRRRVAGGSGPGRG